MEGEFAFAKIQPKIDKDRGQFDSWRYFNLVFSQLFVHKESMKSLEGIIPGNCILRVSRNMRNCIIRWNN